MTDDIVYFRKKPVVLTRNWATDPSDPTTAWLPEVTVTKLHYMTILDFKRLGKFASEADSLLVACAIAEQMLETTN